MVEGVKSVEAITASTVEKLTGGFVSGVISEYQEKRRRKKLIKDKFLFFLGAYKRIFIEDVRNTYHPLSEMKECLKYYMNKKLKTIINFKDLYEIHIFLWKYKIKLYPVFLEIMKICDEFSLIFGIKESQEIFFYFQEKVNNSFYLKLVESESFLNDKNENYSKTESSLRSNSTYGGLIGFEDNYTKEIDYLISWIKTFPKKPEKPMFSYLYELFEKFISKIIGEFIKIWNEFFPQKKK